MTDSPASLPEILPCPGSWNYDELWWDNYIRKHEASYLAKLCRHSSAEFKIGYFIRDLGEAALTKVKTQNLFIKRLKVEKIAPGAIGPHDVDWQHGRTWAYLLQYWEELFDVYNADKAPPDLREVMSEVKIFIDAGHTHCEALLSYIEAAKTIAWEQERRREVDSEPRSQGAQSPNDKWNEIDIAHSKVTHGFVYLLTNNLMPGICKIGFTASNPDKRAKEISARHALPQPFKVMKYWRTLDPYIIEQRIHEALLQYGRQGEFFEVDLAQAIEVIEAHIIPIGIIINHSDP